MLPRRRSQAGTSGCVGEGRAKVPGPSLEIGSSRHSEGSCRFVPLSGGMRANEGLDPRPTPGELLLRPPMVGGHSMEDVRPRLVGVHPADVVLPLLRPSVVPFVVPEVEVPPSVEIANAGAASDFHFHTSKWRYATRGLRRSRGGVRKCFRTGPTMRRPGFEPGNPCG